jgi:endonuclease/exonuclease/phosphatase (EEP) superfamily protein YafD
MAAPTAERPASGALWRTGRRWIERLMLIYGLLLTAYLLARVLIGEQWSLIAAVNNLLPWWAAGGAIISGAALFSHWRWRLIGAQVPILAAFALLYGDLYWPRGPVDVPEGIPITAATYNVLGGASDAQQVAAQIVALDADLVGLQELGGGHAAVFEQQLADEYPHRLMRPLETAFGLGLLSRYPILEAEVVSNFMNYHGDTRSALLRAVIDVQGTPVTVFVVHLPLPITLSPDGTVPIPFPYDTGRHDQQLAALRDFVRAEPGPVLVICDCNMTDQSDGYRRLNDVLDDSYREVGRGMGFLSGVGFWKKG